MSDATVIAATITGIVTVIIAAGGWFAKRAERVTTARQDWQKDLEKRVVEQQASIDELREEWRKANRRINHLEGALQDRDELIGDMVDVVLWVDQGARPPVPEMSWRILKYLRELRPTDQQT